MKKINWTFIFVCFVGGFVASIFDTAWFQNSPHLPLYILFGWGVFVGHVMRAVYK